MTQPAPVDVDAGVLAGVRAALAGGAAPSAALTEAVRAPGTDASATRTALAGVVRQLQVGRPLAAVGAETATGQPAVDLLVRALAVAEEAGSGGLAAVDQALAAVRDEAAVARLLRSRTVQARGTALLLSALPVGSWLLLVALTGDALRFYAQPLGWLTGGAALLLAAAGYGWSRRLVATAHRAATDADPLTPRREPPDAWRALAVGAPALVIGALAAGLAAGLLLGLTAAGAGLVLGRRGVPGVRTAAPRPATRPGGRPGWHRTSPAPGGAADGGAAETVELLSIAIDAGLAVPGALRVTAALAPPPARPLLATAARRLGAGWPLERVLADGGLADAGGALAATERWGAPAAPVLRRLAAELRADRRAAAEEAAERTQLFLVFPTTLLTLPAFVLGVVPPLVWTAFA